MRARIAQAERYTPTSVRPGARVTVVIPCYNYARYLPDAVRSVLTQTGVDVEVIVVDDASTDDSLAVAQEFSRHDPRVRTLANPTNCGHVETFNRGLALADGDYVVRLDADDLLTPGSLARAVAVMQRFSHVGLVYGHPLHFTGERPSARTRTRSWTIWAGREWLEARCTAGTNVITSPEVVMRRSVLDVVGGQRPLAHTPDMELWLRIAAHADIAYVDGCDQAWHRDHDASMSNDAAHPSVILREVRDAFETLCDGMGADPEADRLRVTARRAVARIALEQARRYLDRGHVTPSSEDLRNLALELSPGILQTRAGRQFTAAWQRAGSWPAPLSRVIGVGPRAYRRLHTAAASVRWHRTGVYEPVRITERAACETDGNSFAAGRAT